MSGGLPYPAAVGEVIRPKDHSLLLPVLLPPSSLVLSFLYEMELPREPDPALRRLSSAEADFGVVAVLLEGDAEGAPKAA